MKRRLVIITCISSLIFISFVFILVLVIIPQKKTGECITPGCVHAASRILKDIDPRIEPCDNFYQFACGGYLASTRIPADDMFGVSHVTELVDDITNQLRMSLEELGNPDEPRLFKLAKILYRTCMNTPDVKEADFEPLRRILEQYGKWPVVEGDKWQEDDFDWTKSVYISRKLGFPVNNCITLGVEADLVNTTKHILMLYQAKFGIHQKILVEGIENEYVRTYFKQMIDIATYLGADKERAARELEESLKFEIQLAQKLDRDEYEITIVQLGEEYPFVNWTEYINNLLPPNVHVDVNEVITLSSHKVISYLEELLKITPKRVQANYALWKVAEYAFRYLTKNQGKRQTEYVSTTSENIILGSDHRWKECVGNISQSSLSIITNALYVRKYFKESTRQKVVRMVTEIRDEMIKMLKKAEWMGKKSKSIAVKTAEAILSQVGYPVELFDDNKLEEFYADLKLSPYDFLGNVLHSNKIMLNYAFGMLRKPVNRTEWVGHDISTQVNAFYHPSENSINLPAGILQGTFFDGDRPGYMNYGAIGSVIGHEFSHCFNPPGNNFDEHENPETLIKSAQIAECIINQYSNFTIEFAGVNVDGNKTLVENVADNGGIKTAYLAYKEYVKRNGPEPKLPNLKYTPEQMFWISAANTHCVKLDPQKEEIMIKVDYHCPNRFRVIGSFANSQEFSDDFNCPMGSHMNPVHKCSVL